MKSIALLPSFKKEAKEFFLLSSARRKKQRSIHPLQGLIFTDHPARAMLAWLVQEPFISRVNPRGFHQPQPLLHKKGLQTTPKSSPIFGKDLTAPPVALTLRYPRPIKGSGWFFIGWRRQILENILRQAKRAEHVTARCSMFPRINSRKHSARGGL